MSSSTTWKIPLGTSPRKSDNSGIIRELEQKLKGRQGTADFKLGDMSKVSPLLSPDERQSSKTLSDKQTINENLLQARARWAVQTKERDETTDAGGDDEQSGDKKEFAMSLDGASRFHIDADDRTDTENVNHRSKRAYSTSNPKSQRVIPAPPKNRPPVLENWPLSSGDRPTSPRDNLVRPQQPQRGLQGEKQMKQVTGTGLKKAAMKKLKKLVKGKNKSATNVVKSGSPGNAPRKVGIKKALSENILIHRQIPYAQQESFDDSSIPVNFQARDYQNVFDDGSRSNTNSPTDLSALNNRKPKPFPRRGFAGGIRQSLGSNDSDVETPPPQSLSPLVTSPTNTATPTSAKSDSSANSSSHLVMSELRSPEAAAYFKASNIHEGLLASGEILEEGESTEEDEDLVPYFPTSSVAKKPLGKATSLNPAGSQDWGAMITRKSTSRQKKLRRAVCSDGDQELNDDYITMNSVCLTDYSPVENARSLGRIRGLNAVPSDSCAVKEFKSLNIPTNPKDSLSANPRSPGLSIPSHKMITSSRSNGFLGGPSVPTDEKRSSAYYLKIISSQPHSAETGGGSSLPEKEVEEVEFYGEVCRRPEQLTPGRRAQSKEDITPPVLKMAAIDFAPPSSSSFPEHSWNMQAANSAIPPPRIKSSQDVCSGKVATPESSSQQKRKFQYTSVTVEAGTKRTPSAPKKYKYQTVVLQNESNKTTITETPDPDAAKVKRRVSASKPAQEERRSYSPEAPPAPVKKEHPLLNLEAGSLSTLRQSERSYYINRKSLIEIESCKDLPTTMLSTVDAVTGKVLWHEYVEIDEDQIDMMAKKFGLAKSAPIPEKLGVILGVPKLKVEATAATSEVETVANPDARREERAESNESDDLTGSNSLNSSMSSECNYIFNLNDPPNIPPRPDNLDALVNQLKDRTSDDYSYAFFPGNQIFGKHWMMTKARSASKPSLLAANLKSGPVAAQETQKDKLPETAGQRKISAPLSLALAKAAKKDARLPPPSLPPKSHSLLREQAAGKAAAPEPYLMPIIVRTKETKKKPAKEGNNSPTFVSYIRDNADKNVPDHENQRTRRASPSKPLPYLEHKKMKQQQKLQRLQSDPSSPHSITSPQGSNFMAVGMRYQDTVRRKRGVGRPLGNRGRPRLKGHKKLARQKSHRGSNGKPAGVSQRRGKTSLNSGGVQKRKKPRGPRPELTDQLKRESLALFIESEGALAEKIRASVRKMEAESQGVASGKEDVDTEPAGPTVSHDLGEVLVRLGNLIRDKQCSERDLFTLITNHFKLKLKGESVDTPSNESAVEEEEFKSSDDKDGELDNEASSEEAAKAGLTKNTRRSYVNLVFSDGEETPGTPAINDDESRAEDSKPSHVNLLLSEDDKAGELGTTKSYKPPYINMEFFANNSDQESSEDEFEYVEPSEAIGDHRLMLAMESTMNRTRNSNVTKSDGLNVCPLNTKVTCAVTPPPEPDTRSFPPIPRKRAMSSVISSSQLSMLQPHHERTLSSPQGDLNMTTDELTEESNLDFRGSPLNRRGQGEQAPPELPHDPLRGRTSIDESKGATENTSSYNLALEMEDIRFSRSLEEGIAHKAMLSRVAEEEEGKGEAEKDTRERQSLSASSKSLQRANAKKRPSRLNTNNGIGVFTHKGGKLVNEGSGITVEIPENAIPRGQTQKIWFKVVQTVYDPSKDEDSAQSLSDSGSVKLESLMQEKREKRVQLSPMVVVGPAEAVLTCPIVVRMPHCLPYRNNSWHLQMLGQASLGEGSEEESWSEIVNTIGLVQLPMKNNSKFHKKSAYQMHLDYVQIKTSRLGCFKLVGRPIRNGTYAAKKMVASVYSKARPGKESIQFDLFVNNAIEDQSHALENSLTHYGHTPLLKNMPILCFGDGKDMEVTLSNDSNCAIPLGTKAIPFGQFWRSNKVGQSHLIFDIDTDLVEDDRTLTLKIQQAGSKLYHETNFLLSDI